MTRLPGFRSDGGVDTGALTEEQESGADGMKRTEEEEATAIITIIVL